MIINRLELVHNIVVLTPEQPDDLWILRRIISKGDLVKSETSRVVKDTAEYARPDKERVKVVITVEVEQIRLDATISRIRISGQIVDVSNDIMSKGFHSLSISEGHRLSIKKPEGFSQVQINLIHGAEASKDSYLIVALDGREAGIGNVKGTHLKILPTVESGLTGKMYVQSKKPTNYFDKIADILGSEYREKDQIFVLGPGTTKNSLANYLMQNRKQFDRVSVIEGSDVAGEDGVYVAMRNPNLQEALGETRLSKVSKILVEIMRRISLNDNRVALAFNDNFKAAKGGAIESLVVSEVVFSLKGLEEDFIVELLNSVEESRGETFLLDSTTDLGKQVNSLGGAVGLLRFVVA